jgi:nucleoside-diphosphate kinase
MSNTERTFIMIKPDGVHRGLVGEIIKRFEQKGYKLVAMKFEQVVFSFSVERLFP